MRKRVLIWLEWAPTGPLDGKEYSACNPPCFGQNDIEYRNPLSNGSPVELQRLVLTVNHPATPEAQSSIRNSGLRTQIRLLYEERLSRGVPQMDDKVFRSRY